jgi:hypothetical protein
VLPRLMMRTPKRLVVAYRRADLVRHLHPCYLQICR